jgi:hypothetical protein
MVATVCGVPARADDVQRATSGRLVQPGVELAGDDWSGMEWLAVKGPLERFGHGLVEVGNER